MLYLPSLFHSLSVLTSTVPFLLNFMLTIISLCLHCPVPIKFYTYHHFSLSFLYLPSLFPFLSVLTITFPFPFCTYHHFTESHVILTITLLNPTLYLPSLYWIPFCTYHHFTESRFILTITLQFQFSTYRHFSVPILYIPSFYRSHSVYTFILPFPCLPYYHFRIYFLRLS